MKTLTNKETHTTPRAEGPSNKKCPPGMLPTRKRQGKKMRKNCPGPVSRSRWHKMKTKSTAAWLRRISHPSVVEVNPCIKLGAIGNKRRQGSKPCHLQIRNSSPHHNQDVRC
ncbi:unnamed protein product [Amoebophrya sp. A120]|nr:unnamed protein product [Amoebophrya sp. A120]|eukprot:GSA120T00025983001.1